jgi:hypothetical protein
MSINRLGRVIGSTLRTEFLLESGLRITPVGVTESMEPEPREKEAERKKLLAFLYSGLP